MAPGSAAMSPVSAFLLLALPTLTTSLKNVAHSGGSPLQAHKHTPHVLPSNDKNKGPLVAVCVVGLVRNFVDPIVHTSIKQNLLDKISDNAYAITILKRYDDHLGDKGMVSKKKINHALRVIRPIRSIIYDKEEQDFSLSASSCHYDAESVPKTNMGVYYSWKNAMKQPNPPLFRNSLGQMKGAWDCVQQVKDVEKQYNVTFDAVFRGRTDSVWVKPVKPAKELMQKTPKSILHWWDMAILAPRNATGIFTHFYDGWTKCKGSWKGRSVPEMEWEDGAMTTGHAYVKYDFPQVVKRTSICKGRAIWNCQINVAGLSFEQCLMALYPEDAKTMDIKLAQKTLALLDKCKGNEKLTNPNCKKEHVIGLWRKSYPKKCTDAVIPGTEVW